MYGGNTPTNHFIFHPQTSPAKGDQREEQNMSHIYMSLTCSILSRISRCGRARNRGNENPRTKNGTDATRCSPEVPYVQSADSPSAPMQMVAEAKQTHRSDERTLFLDVEFLLQVRGPENLSFNRTGRDIHIPGPQVPPWPEASSWGRRAPSRTSPRVQTSPAFW